MDTRIKIHFEEDLKQRIEKRRQGKHFSTQVADDLKTYYALLDATREELKGTFTGEETTLLIGAAGREKFGLSLMKMWPILVASRLEIIESGLKTGLVKKVAGLRVNEICWLVDRCSIAARLV
jgi:hypothetical protein